jgi:hypothetical protein
MRRVGSIYLTHTSLFTLKYGAYVCRAMAKSGEKELALAHHSSKTIFASTS